MITNIKQSKKILAIRNVLFNFFRQIIAYGEDAKHIKFPIREIDRAQEEIDVIYNKKLKGEVIKISKQKNKGKKEIKKKAKGKK